MLRFARIGIPVLIAGLLVGALVLPAKAQQVEVTFSGAVEAGQIIELRCPEGYQVQRSDSGAVNASASFYRTEKGRGVIAVGVPADVILVDAAGNLVGVQWFVPKGARYATATLSCVPIVTQPPPTTPTSTSTSTSTTTPTSTSTP